MTTNYYARWLGKCHFLKPKINNISTMFLLFILLIGGTIYAQDTFTGDNTGATIDGSVIVESAANSNLTGTIGTDYVIDNVTIDITHPYVSDLDIKLQSPDGTILDLSLGNGSSGDNYTNTVFEDGGADITAATPPFTGTFEPQGGTFAATFDTESVNGDWKLLMEDTYATLDDGVFNSYEITFAPPPACPEPVNLSTSNITSDAVDLNWDDVANATDGFEWSVYASGDDPATATAVDTGTVGAGVTTANVTGLTPQTDYDFYIRSDCGATDGTSTLAGPVTFTTLCSPFAAPSWSEDFENAGSIPDCWAQGENNAKDWEFADDGGFDHIGDDGTIGGNTSSDGYFAWLDDSSPHEIGTALVSPLIDVSALTIPQVNFYLLSNNEGNTNVDFSLDIHDGTSWVEDVFFSNSNTANGEWELIEVPLSSLNITGNIIQIRFSVDENNGTDFYDDVAIDDVTVVEAPSCVKPLGLSTANITADAVDLSWNDEPTASDGYEWVVMASGDAPDTANAVLTATAASAPANVTGLSSNTDYDAYVRSVCDAAASESSDWSNAVSFTTLCSPFTTPYSENFDGVTEPNIPNCWSTAGSMASEIITAEANFGLDDPTSAPNFLQFGDENFVDGDEAILVSPQFSDLPDGDNQIRFKAAFEDGDAESHKLFIGVMSDPTDASTFVQISEITSSADASFSEYTVTLCDTNLIGSNEYIAIAAGSVADFDEIAIDDFFYEEISATCIAPQNSSVTNVTASSADLNWDEACDTATDGYQWLIMAEGDAPDPFNAIDSGSVNNGVFTVSVNGLSPDTNYDAYVRSNCGGGDISSWTSATSFSTDIATNVVSPGNIESEAYCYNDSEFKEWLFESSDGSPLQIEFLQGSVEVNTFSGGTYDDLIIYDGQDDTGTILFDSDADDATAADLTGLTLTANSGFMYITLDSDGSNSCDSGSQTEIQFEVSIPQFASVQVIHNSADPAANLVDVYLNGVLLLDDFEFRTATPFVDVPAGTPIDIDIAPGTSTDVSESIFNLNTTLAADETYVVVANGVLDPAQFDSSVNTIDFNLDVFAGAQQASTNAGETSLLINHGSPDAPMVDVVETTLPPSTLADNMSYPEFQGYVDVPTADYVLNVETADNATVVATYEAPLQTLGLGDQAISVLASGFLDPAANQNGPAFGLWVALPAGGPLVELPFVEPEPAAPAPDPTEDSEDVISMFSGVYTDVPVDTWLTSWSSAQLADIQIQGNDTKLYTDLDFAGAETVANPIDASGMDFFHIDVWSPNATTFRVKLVDLGATVEGELAFDIAQEQWVSLQIPLDDFADPNLVTDPNNLLTVRNSIQQVIISGLPAGAVTAYVDNVYFSTDDISTTQFNDDNFKFYPNPVVNTLNLNTSGVVENIKLYNVLGQEIMDVNPEVQSPQIEMGELQSGAYMMKVTIDGASQSFRVIKK